MPRQCEFCGAGLVRRLNEGSHWHKRRFCNPTCSNRAKAHLQHRPKPQAGYRSRYRTIKRGGRQILEHRWVMEQVLGRRLHPDEQVHHVNGNRLDNRPENLRVMTAASHMREHAVYPLTKRCVVCGVEFTPHKTKRKRQQTCGDRTCRTALIRQKRWGKADA